MAEGRIKIVLGPNLSKPRAGSITDARYFPMGNCLEVSTASGLRERYTFLTSSHRDISTLLLSFGIILRSSTREDDAHRKFEHSDMFFFIIPTSQTSGALEIKLGVYVNSIYEFRHCVYLCLFYTTMRGCPIDFTRPFDFSSSLLDERNKSYITGHRSSRSWK